MVLLVRLLLQRLLLLPRGRLLVVVVPLLQLQLRLLLLLVVGEELVAGELVEEGLSAAGLVYAIPAACFTHP